MPVQQWKTPEEVEHLTVSKTRIGKGDYGDIYLGRIKFKGTKPRRVAIKVFNKRFEGEKYKDSYEKAIKELTAAGVYIPKTGFTKHNGQWVQVMHLFGATKGTKIIEQGDAEFEEAKKIPAVRQQIFDTLVKIANTGHLPAGDSIGLVKTKGGYRVIVHDLDAYGHPNYWNNITMPREFHLLPITALLFSRGSGELPSSITRRLTESILHPEIRKAFEKEKAALQTYEKRGLFK